MILSIISQKGGSGKTTIALNIAGCVAAKKQRVLLVDADDQGSALAWLEMRETEPEFAVIGMPTGSLHRDLPKIASDYDLTIIDCPPRLQKIARSAITASTGVLIPVAPSPLDIWAAEEIVNLVQEVQEFQNVKAAMLMNRKIVGTALSKEVQKGLGAFGLPVLKAALSQRVAFAEAMISGQTVQDYQRNSKAAKEAEKLTKEVLRWLKS